LAADAERGSAPKGASAEARARRIRQDQDFFNAGGIALKELRN
jgi:hypothetical protein